MPYRIVIENDVVKLQALDPEASFVNAGTQPMDCVTIVDCWQWAYSDLISNTERGVLAEYLVAKQSVRGSEPRFQYFRWAFTRYGYGLWAHQWWPRSKDLLW